jgi:hypothetical protein
MAGIDEYEGREGAAKELIAGAANDVVMAGVGTETG